MTYRPGMRIGVWAAVFAGAALAAWPSTAAAQGTGLWADYYDALDFSGVVSSRTDATVDFPDFASPPAPGLTNDETFVVRWQGRVQAPAGLAAGSVITFYLRTDDGGRLWVDGRLVIDQWEQQGVPAQPGPSGTVTTTGGQFHNVRVEQYEQNGGDGAVLEWSYTGQTQQVVPQVNLFPQAAAVRILPNGGTFTNSVTVRLGVDTLGKPGQAVVVRYTTNGSDINAETDGIAYTGPFVLIGNATVKARIFRSDMPTPAGPQVQASFTVSDAARPTLTTVRSIGADRLLLTFNEALDAAIAQTATNYAVNGVDASAAVLQPDLASVVVTHAGLTVGGDFVLTVRNLADRTGNALAAAVNRAFTHRPPTATNLLDLYALDEGTGTTTADGSANALGGGNGTLLSAADVPRWIEGRIGSALDFDGINDEIDVAPLELFLGTSCSVTFWTKTQARGRVDGTNNRNVHGVVGRSDPDTADEGVAVLFGYMDGNGQIVAKGGVTGAQVDSGVTISDDQWHHVAINRTELSGNITIFIDGIQRASVSSGAGVKTGPFDRIGVILNTESSALRWLGALDEVRFYTSTLAANDVVDMVNAPPVVTASATVSGALTANLTGGATDDGLPQPAALTWAWSVVSTPAGGSVTFGTASGTGATANSSATFTTGGDYVLRLTYDDGRLKCSQDVAVSLSKVAVTPSATPLVTTEAGGTATFNVVLTVQPTTDVVINVSTSDTTEGLVSCATATPPVNTPANSLVLTFTSTNWNSAQTVTVTGVDDPARDGNINYTILVSIDPASDPAFTGESTPDPACVNNDNDTPGITVTPTSLTTAEGAAPAQFTVVLDTQPSGNVVITVASSNTPQATVAPPTLTFDGTNWNTPQPVQVTAVDDTVIDFTQSATIVLDVDAAATADADYDVLNPADVSVSVLDNEAIPPPEEAWGNCGGNAAGTSGAGWMALLALAAALGLRRRS